jgi:PTS system nitrogen regulatory IIA component
MMNNDSALQLSNVLNQECTRSQVHCQSKKRALEIISELAAKQLSLPPQVVFEAILTREKWAVPGLATVLPFPRKTGRGYAACRRRFVQLETPIAFDAIDNQPVDLLFALLVPADQTKPTCIRSRWWPNGWRIKPFAVACARRKAMKSCMRSSPKQEAAMTHNGSRTLSFIVLRRNGTWY